MNVIHCVGEYIFNWLVLLYKHISLYVHTHTKILINKGTSSLLNSSLQRFVSLHTSLVFTPLNDQTASGRTRWI